MNNAQPEGEVKDDRRPSPPPSEEPSSRGSRARAWCLTLNNWTPAELETLQGVDCKYLVIGKEVAPETGTPHLQGYIYFKNKKSLRQMKTLNRRAHWAIAKGTGAQNKLYCTKDGDFIEKGTCPTNGGTATLNRLEKNKLLLSKSLKALVDDGDVALVQLPVLRKARLLYSAQHPPKTCDTVRGVWIYGPPGTGKSHYARTTYDNLYIKGQHRWWDGYTGQPNVLLDDLDTHVLGHYLKIWLDRWACTGEIKGGVINLQHDKFIITSNYTPEQIWQDDEMMARAIRRRCEFKQFNIVFTA